MTLKTWLANLMPERHYASERKHWMQYKTFTGLFNTAPLDAPFVHLAIQALSHYQTFTLVDWLLERVRESNELDTRLFDTVKRYQHYRTNGAGQGVCWTIQLLEAHLQAWRVFKEVVDLEQATDRAWRADGCPGRCFTDSESRRGDQARAVQSVLNDLVTAGEISGPSVMFVGFCSHAPDKMDPFYAMLGNWLREHFTAKDDCTLVSTQ